MRCLASRIADRAAPNVHGGVGSPGPPDFSPSFKLERALQPKLAQQANDRGQVIGISGICQNAVGDQSATHALLWENGQPTDLGNLGSQVWNTPISLNNHGEVVGFANNALNNSQGFLWTKANGMQPLPYIGDDNAGAAYNINDMGQIVGISNGGTEPYSARAFLYENGTMNDLNTLVVGDSGLYLLLAQGINNRGEIVGTAAEPDGMQVGFLAVPADAGPAGPDSPMGGRAGSRTFAGRPDSRPRLIGFPRLSSERPQTK